jgi:hypothetical protein
VSVCLTDICPNQQAFD